MFYSRYEGKQLPQIRSVRYSVTRDIADACTFAHHQLTSEDTLHLEQEIQIKARRDFLHFYPTARMFFKGAVLTVTKVTPFSLNGLIKYDILNYCCLIFNNK